MAQTIRIAVKGTEEQAARAMADRAVTGRHYAQTRHGESLWDVPEGQRALLTAWFAEAPEWPPAGGFPAGTLLFHR